MSEERFEAWLKDNASAYHRPPDDVPREAMWDAISRARQARPVSVAGRIGTRVSPVRYAVAASLLIGAGIGMGYWMRGAGTSTPAAASVAVRSDSVLSSTTYDVVSVQHLSAAEALLTSFHREERTEGDVAIRRWARDLLASTRLLIDSPAGEDAVRRQLLEDLEYVLAQIVQLDPNAPAEDRAMVDRAINRGQVLTRIRSSIPAGFPSGS